jgi:hypothetical protein
MPMEFIVTSLHINAITKIKLYSTMEKQLSKLMELEEDFFILGFHHMVQKSCEKSWNERNIK